MASPRLGSLAEQGAKRFRAWPTIDTSTTVMVIQTSPHQNPDMQKWIKLPLLTALNAFIGSPRVPRLPPKMPRPWRPRKVLALGTRVSGVALGFAR